jgi:hypothetical protein
MCLQCPVGWSVLSNRCYFISGWTTDWNGANSYCVSQSASMMVVNSQAEYDLLSGFYDASGVTQVWVK